VGGPGGIVVVGVDSAGVFAPDDVVGGVDSAVVVEIIGLAGKELVVAVNCCR
jgi:hypothetical protein